MDKKSGLTDFRRLWPTWEMDVTGSFCGVNG